MSAKQLIVTLNDHGVTLSVQRGKLNLGGDQERLSSQLRAQVQFMHDELVALLDSSSNRCTKTPALAVGRVQALQSYWASRLSSKLTPIDLPFDFARPSVRTTEIATLEIKLPSDLLASLRALARETGGTTLTVHMAALKSLLHRYGNKDEIIIGTPVGDAPDSPLGMLPIATLFPGDSTFREVIEMERCALDGALAHKELSFERILEAVARPLEPGYHPVFQVALRVSQIDSPCSTEHKEAAAASRMPYDLDLHILETGSELHGRMHYDPALFNRATIQGFAANYVTLLTGGLEQADAPICDLPFLAPEQRRTLLCRWNDTVRDYPTDATLTKMFEAQVDRTPDSTALVFEQTELTYAQFEARTNQLARYLVAQGVGPEMPVGLYLERSIEMLVGIYGILKAGGAYMPLDPDLPSERIAFMLEESKPAVVLTQDKVEDNLPASSASVLSLDGGWDAVAQYPPERLPLRAGPENLAYIIYTSGSTGRPKGVMVEHRAICNRQYWALEEYGFCEDDVVIHKFPFSFDASICELFTPLFCGGRMVIARPNGHRDSAYLTQQILRHGVTTIQIVPSMLEMLIDDGSIDQCHTLRRVLCGGEPLSYALHKRLARLLPDCELHNMYGPTEAAINVTAWSCRLDGQHRTIPIGLPVSNTQLYILDENLESVPVGANGELYIGGAQLARGYLNRQDLTRERFVASPFQEGAVLYKTGDLCRYFQDGSIEYVNRIDFQVKVRGQRIELGEIESAILECASVPVQAIVNPWSPSPSDVRLVAYIEGKAFGDDDIEQLQSELRRRLPTYMVPQHFVRMTELPKTTSGKVDRKQLPAPEIKGIGDSAEPETAVEKEMARLWQQRLGVSQIGPSDSFFDLGGHSLSAVQLSADIRRSFKVHFPTRCLMDEPQLGAVSRHVERMLAEKSKANEGTTREVPAAAATTPGDQNVFRDEAVPTRRLARPNRRENWWIGFKNRFLQVLALYAPGLTTLRVKLHRARGVEIGKNVAIGLEALIETSYPQLVSIGNNVSIGIRAVFIGHFGEMTAADASTRPTIRVEDDVFIGPGVTILPNVTIGRGSVITAGSVINTSVPPKTVMQGNPAMPVARCNAPLAWNSYANYMQNLEPLDGADGGVGNGENSDMQK